MVVYCCITYIVIVEVVTQMHDELVSSSLLMDAHARLGCLNL